MTYNHDIFNDAIEKKCQACHRDDVEIRSFSWGSIEITACEKCINDVRKRITYGLREQHAFHESEFIGVKI